ncbi:MAG: AMP-binding protein [Lentisphaeria bacterium]|nr:AMP-binding protein [Lentisphaeria bacterium]
MSKTKPPYTIGYAAGVNFLSSFNPALFCSFSALLIYYTNPLFSKLSFHVLLVFGIFALPLVISGAPVQYLINRFSCRNVVILSRAAEMITMLAGTVTMLLVPNYYAMPLLPVILLLGIEYAIYRPALKCYTAEMVDKPFLSWSSAATEAAGFLGIGVGGVVALATFTVAWEYHGAYWPAGLYGAAVSFYSLILATRLNPDLPINPKLKIIELPGEWLETFRRQPRFRELVLTGIGESYVFGSMILLAAMTVLYIGVQFSSVQVSQLPLFLLMPSTVLGCMAGCIVGGWRSRGNVEIGLVPPATLAMSLLCFLVGLLPYYSDLYIESGLLFLLLAGIGFFAGIILVPMQAYQTYFVKREQRPAYFGWFYVPFGLGLLAAMTLSYLMYSCEISIFRITLALAVATFALSCITFSLMPRFVIRMLMKILLGTLYRVRIFGRERIPESGPALLVSNSASFVDLFFISACTTRPIWFMMHESIFRNRFMRPFYKAAGFLEVPSARPKQMQHLLEKTRHLLANGEVVCVFPEGDITRNGLMSEFKNGLTFLLPEGVEVPILPLRIGMTWGSIFSCYYGKFKLRWPTELPHPASVTIGKAVPRDISAYELRILLTELGAETELVAGPQERPFHSQFAFIAKRFPRKRQVVEYGPDHQASIRNRDLLVQAIILSRYLREISDEETTHIAMMLPNGIPAVLCLLGIQFSDRIPAVLNYTASRGAIRATVGKTGAKHILTSRAFVEKSELEVLPGMIFLEDILPKLLTPWVKFFWGAVSVILDSKTLMKLVSPVSWQDVNRCGIVIFSSGSTGIPKGIMLSHHNITCNASSVISIIGWTRKDCILGNLPIFHSFGTNVCLWLPLISGCRTVLVPNPLDAYTVGRALREQHVTVMMATPGFLQTYMRRCKPEDFKSLRLVVAGAEKLRSDIAARFQRTTGLEIVEGYGCTELSPVVSFNLANSILDLGLVVAKLGSIGQAIPGICVKIVDPVTFELMPEDTDGLLIVKGANVMLGYLGDPKKTAEVIRDGWYITGDIARMNRNGTIFITGRISRFSKIAGEMVPHELVEREINNILRPDHQVIAVAGGEDHRRGEKLIVFYSDRKLVKPDELVKQLRAANIPNLWIPKPENFVWIEKIPQLGSGKLDLAKLAEKANEFCRTGKAE